MKKHIFFFALSILAIVITFITGDATAGLLLATGGVAWPSGDVDLQQPAYAATLAVTITDQFTILDPAILTGAMTINLTIPSTLRKGAVLMTQITATGTEVATFGTGFTAGTQTGVAGKTKCAMFIYDGTTFKVVGTPIQID
jgi:hypothetical protein